jgi:hypothetical protein
MHFSCIGVHESVNSVAILCRCASSFIELVGRAIAQAVSCWLPTATARTRARVRSCGICGEQSGTGAGFVQVLGFSLPIFIPSNAPQSPSSIIWGWYNRPVVAAVPSGLSLTPLSIYIYIYIERERERELVAESETCSRASADRR